MRGTALLYLLDTNACIRILNDSSPKLTKRFRKTAPNQCFLCSVVKSELLYGARNSQKAVSNLRVLEKFFDPMESLPFDDFAAEKAGIIRAELKRAGTPIGPNDLLIAAIALAHGKILVTNNTREFGRIALLKLEDWEAQIG